MSKNPYSQRLRQVCEEIGLNAHELAKILGVPKPTVERWIYGTTKPKIEALSLLASKLGANPIYLLTGQGPPVIEKAKGVDVATLAAQALSQGKKKLRTKNGSSGATMRPS